MHCSFVSLPFRNILVAALLTAYAIEVSGQIDTSYPAYKIPAEYSSVQYPDTIMVFCKWPVELIASINGDNGIFNFEWSRYNRPASIFELFHTESGPVSTISGIEEGGYRVRIYDADEIDTTFVVWVFEKSVEVNASIDYIECGELALHGSAEAPGLIHYHPQTHEQFELNNDFTFEWTSSPSTPIPYPSENLSTVTYSPPYEDTWFYLTVTDNFECTVTDSVFYETIEVKADFVPEPLEGPAPLEVKFTNNSINGAVFQWFFGEPDGFQGVPDDHSFEPVHVFTLPREYFVRLKAFSEAGCEDEFTYPDPVNVHYSMLQVPNVFTPDGDGINDIFMINSRSLRDFRGVIYNRNGQKLFEWTDPDEGWDGLTPRGKEAPPGVYYYIIKGRGWDGKEYEFTGALHLFRGK